MFRHLGRVARSPGGRRDAQQLLAWKRLEQASARLERVGDRAPALRLPDELTLECLGERERAMISGGKAGLADDRRHRPRVSPAGVHGIHLVAPFTMLRACGFLADPA